MHSIEPYYRWRDDYTAEEDEQSPFYGREYSEFEFSNKIYNYFIHPQWDEFGSPTLYMKIIFVDYAEQFAVIELLGEWNDCIQNDVMFLKRDVIDQLQEHDINKFIVIGENVLNFHASDDCYYEEWYEDVMESNGWICFLNFREHVIQEMESVQLQQFVNFDEPFNDINWRRIKPAALYLLVQHHLNNPKQYYLTG